MFKSVGVCYVLYVIFLGWTVEAITPEQREMIHQHFESLEVACMGEYPITNDDITNLKSKQMATGPNVPCFLSCILKKIGVIDEEGKLQKETALNLARQVFTTDEEIQLISDYLHSCSHINDKPVTDGNKGCDRAIMAFECLAGNAARFEFDF